MIPLETSKNLPLQHQCENLFYHTSEPFLSLKGTQILHRRTLEECKTHTALTVSAYNDTIIWIQKNTVHKPHGLLMWYCYCNQNQSLSLNQVKNNSVFDHHRVWQLQQDTLQHLDIRGCLKCEQNQWIVLLLKTLKRNVAE